MWIQNIEKRFYEDKTKQEMYCKKTEYVSL